jgi:Zn-dependent M28 family amino/carboxypeptidase
MMVIINYEVTQQEFNGQRALDNVVFQMNLGPRTVGSNAHDQVVNWIKSNLQAVHWSVEIQEQVFSGKVIQNIVAHRGTGKPWIIIAAHYDSRFVADQDPVQENRMQPVPGANDGASGVAVLLELARVVPADIDKQIWLVFLDAEDNGNYPGWDWALGAQAFVGALEGKPDSVIILDMIGDKDLNIYMERNSNPELTEEIWAVAANLGYVQFIPVYKHRMIDDHIPFIQAGIRAIDIIDFDYPYWHTTSDTLDKVSAESLKVVGETILTWLKH